MHADVRAFLDAHHVAHLATAGRAGAHAAPVFFAPVGDGLRLTWISATHVLHSVHIAENPAVALSVSPSTPSLARIEGVQMRGLASSPDAEQDALAAAYFARFPAARAMAAVARDHRFYVFRPTWVRLVRLVAGVSATREFTIDGLRG